ncbi:MAG: hypothetical protein DMF25_05575 [Verrucomicrobia bacterium]|nr:MAG: hypothetical protein DMF25_05575 [Verrucomicrobiota bacterium]
MRLKNTFVSAIAVAACVGLPVIANAVSLSLADVYELGFVKYGIPSGDDDRTFYVNDMIGLAPGGSNHVIIGPHDNLVTRSNNLFGPLPGAVFALDGTGTSVNLGTGGFEYLFAKYDGPKYGAEVWDISGLTGTITIPAKGGKYDLSGWTLFTPDRVNNVPDGGTTLMLLSSAFSGLAVMRRLVRRQSRLGYNKALIK